MEFLKTVTDFLGGETKDVKKEAEEAVAAGKEKAGEAVEKGKKGVMEHIVDLVLKSFPEPFHKPVKGILKMLGVISDKEQQGTGKIDVDFKKEGAELAKDIKALRGLTWGKSEIDSLRGQVKGVEPRVLAGLFLFESGKESEGSSIVCTQPTALPEGQELRVDFPAHNKELLDKEQFTLFELVGYDKEVQEVTLDGKIYIRAEGKFIEKGGEKEGKVSGGSTLEITKKGALSEEEKTKETEQEVQETQKNQEVSKENRSIEIGGTKVELKALQEPESLRKGLEEACASSKENVYKKNLSGLSKEGGTLAQAFDTVAQTTQLNAYQQSMLMLLLPGLMKEGSGIKSTQNGKHIGIMGLPKSLYEKEEIDPKEHIGGKGRGEQRSAQISFVIQRIGEFIGGNNDAVKKEANTGKQVLLAVDELYGSGTGARALKEAWTFGKDAYTKAK